MESVILIRNHLQSRRSATAADDGFRPTGHMSCSHGDANIGGLQNTTYLILAGVQYLNYRTHSRNSTLLLLVTTNSNCTWGVLQIDSETKQLRYRLLIHSWLRYDELDGEDSRSVHRYWRWGSWVPHATPPHAQMNPESPSASSFLWWFSSQECSKM